MKLTDELPNKMSELDQAAVDYFISLPDKWSHNKKLNNTAFKFMVSTDCIQRILNDWAGIKKG